MKFALGKGELSYWNSQDKKWVMGTEKFDVWVDQDSTAKLHGGFEVTAQ